MDLSLGLDNTHVLVTGGAGMIGQKIVQAFLAAGARVSSLDIAYPRYHIEHHGRLLELYADTSSEGSLLLAWEVARQTYGTVEVCVAAAALDSSVLQHSGVVDMPLGQFQKTLEVNVVGTFATAREWLRGLRNHKLGKWGVDRELKNVSLIIIGSEAGSWGDRMNPDYASSKAAVQVGLLQSLRQEAPRIYPGARVNAVAPGPVNTPKLAKECADNPEMYYNECQATTALRIPVEMEQVAKSVLWLASEAWSANVHGQVVNVDCGKLGKIAWGKNEC